MKDGRARKSHGHRRPMDEWEVLIRDHHPGYISWEEYLGNQKQLQANAAMRGDAKTGAAKKGPALLAGLLRCARCGRKLHVGYGGLGGRVPRYYCRGGNINHGTPRCLSLGGLRIDQAVSEAVLQAVQPVGVQAAWDAWQQASHREDEKRKALELALEKARYEADRARRQYDAVEPENRLVAAELEGRWNQALRCVTEVEQRLEEWKGSAKNVDETVRERLLDLGEDLKEVWNHPAASPALKKRILRTVLEEIVVDVANDPPETVLWLHWAGGIHTQLHVPRNATGKHRHCTGQEVVELIRELAKVSPDRFVAAILNRLGYRTGTGRTWIESRVHSVRIHYGIPAAPPEKERAWLTLQETAAALRVSPTSIRKLMQRGILRGQQVVPIAPWVIAREQLRSATVQAAAKAIRQGRRLPRTDSAQRELPLK